MDLIWQKFTEWLKELLVSGIMDNVNGLFDNVNSRVAGIAGLVMRQSKNLGKGLDKLEYRLKGRLVTGNFGGYDFDQKGELDPAKLFRDGRPAKAPSEQF